MKVPLCPVALVMFLVVGCSSSDPAVTPSSEAEISESVESEPELDADFAEIDVDVVAIDAAFDEWAEGVDGGGVGLVQFGDGSVHLVDAGKDAATGEPLSAQDDRVRVGSISKVFTATLVMQLVDEGLVELDEPALTYLPNVAIDSTITVRHLLAHESGIPNYTEDVTLMNRVIAEPTLEPTPEDVLSFVEGGSDFPPGNQFAYSNSNYIVAGLIVEAVTGQSLNDALGEMITDPLGLTKTEFDDGTLEDVAGGYTLQFSEGQSEGRSYQSVADTAWAAGAMVTTVSELAVFFNALYVEDELLAPELLAEMLDGLSGRFQYGLGTHAGPDFGHGHGGAIIGFNSMAEVDPETGEMVIVVINNDNRSPEVASAVLADFLS